MATIVERERPGGGRSYQVRWREGGKQKSQAAAGRTDKERKANASTILRVVEAHGTWSPEFVASGVPTVREQAETFLRRRGRANDATKEDYRRIIGRRILPTLGDLPLTALTVDMLTDWGNALPGAGKTQANTTALMHGILKSAVPEHLAANPWERVQLDTRRTRKRRDRLDPSDLRLILGELPEHYRPLITTLAFTGLRWGEVAALSVGDVEVTSAGMDLRVEKAVKHRARQTDNPGETKTAKSDRVVEVPPEVAPVIRALLERPADAPLFATPTGKRIRNSTFHTLVWQPTIRAAQEKGLTWRPRIHDLRAAATTWMIEKGMDITDVADVLGHQDINTTFAIYRRVNPQARRKAAQAMSAVLAEVMRPEIEG